MKGDVTELDVLNNLAVKHKKTPAQITLRWHLQRGIAAIPKSSNKSRFDENIEIFDFELSAEDMASITSLNQEKRFGADPNNFNF